MGHHKAESVMAAFLLVFCFSTIPAAPLWNLFGLADRSINCILADDTTMILAGTSTGMSVYWNKAWHDFSLAMPVTSIVRLSTDVIAVGAGNGSRSDAVYLGKRIIKGPPFYQLFLQHYFLTPTAMELKGTMAIPRLYAGSGKQGVSVFMLGNDTLIFERALKIPAYAFGVESPRCADLTWFDDTRFFTGGYDQSVNPGTGSLLELVTDSLQIIRKLNVTALARGSFFEVAPLELVIGTTDTGVILCNPAAGTWSALSRPDNGPINDVLVLRPMISWSDMLLCAANSGVFTNNGRSTTWTAVGRTPKAPLCLAGRGIVTGRLTGELFAGTAQGVYFYAEASGTVPHKPSSTAISFPKPRLSHNGKITLPLEWNNGKPVYVTVFSMAGQVIAKEMTSEKSISLKLPAGVFYYKCVTAEMIMKAGTLTNY